MRYCLLPFLLPLSLCCCGPATLSPPEPAQLSPSRSAAGDALVDDLARRSFRYFREQTGVETGIVLDRARTDAGPLDDQHKTVGSIAATGFGLTALCIGAERGWAPREQARERVKTTLKFFLEKAPQERGWFYHWVDIHTGERRWKSEVSSIDTALLLAGVLTCRQYFVDDPEIVSWATRIYERVDFQWMLDGHPTLLSHGWYPEKGFVPHRWDTYNEDTILYLLGIGSPAHPLSPASWRAWKRDPNRYAGYSFIGTAPLFTHQFSQAWVDYRGRREAWVGGIDYFANSVAATRAHRRFCIDLGSRFPSYSENLWGITPSDSVNGYVAWGGPPARGPIDGTIVPCAAAGSLMFTPDICVPALETMRHNFGDRVYGRYGFADAFNPLTGWTDPDVIGIDLGITLLSAENLRAGSVWRWFMANPEIPAALEKVGLGRVTDG
jgi:hypothetical protein